MSKLSQVEAADLSSTKESLMAISGRYGSRTIGDTTARVDLNVTSISIREDATTFTTLVCEGGGTTLGTTFFLGGAAATKAGDLWVAPEGYRFTSIDLSAGSIQITGPNIGS
jgi:hypothetical protein